LGLPEGYRTLIHRTPYTKGQHPSPNSGSTIPSLQHGVSADVVGTNVVGGDVDSSVVGSTMVLVLLEDITTETEMATAIATMVTTSASTQTICFRMKGLL